MMVAKRKLGLSGYTVFIYLVLSFLDVYQRRYSYL
jgi:hypothetical protein